ncbi:MAG TPA: aldo/keto reductase, partial [Cyanobacteria bacterium UBA11371]|nr:aldo/keto reductase [Cyanobacteria bacterium UBA11371]
AKAGDKVLSEQEKNNLILSLEHSFSERELSVIGTRE